MRTWLFSICMLLAISALATDYNVGPGQPLTAIADVPWESLEPGDRVYIHWQPTPYYEKWVINVQGTELNPIEIIGVDGPNGEQPIISGDGATTPDALNFWNEVRGVIKVGGSNSPEDDLPSHILIENLEIRSAHPDYQFTNDNGVMESYVDNAAAIYVEKAANLTIRGCHLHDCGNGLFIGAFNGQTQNILIEKNYIHGNGIVGEFLEHNTYTSAIGITYQFNRFGPLREGADGNNLKDRSAGLVVKYNWIEGGNRQLDLVDAEGIGELVNHPSYSTTHVYGNILIEPDDEGNSQIIHYGGDSSTEDDFRKGILYLYNNTIISTREGNTTVVRLSTNDETALAFNNVIYTTASGDHLAMIAGSGTIEMHHNWVNSDWQDCHCNPEGSVVDSGDNIEGDQPGFEDFDSQNFVPLAVAPIVDNGTDLQPELLPDYDVSLEYLKHQESIDRWNDGVMDIGALEFLSEITNANELESVHFEMFPNPVKDQLNIKLQSDEESFVLEITTILGDLKMRLEISKDTAVDTSSLPSGIYQITLFNPSSRQSGTFVKL
jgi:hypothetical protein